MQPSLGIDYGRAKIGLALATGPLAEPLSTIQRTTALRLLPQIVSRYQIKTVIIGLPEGALQKEVLGFVSQLKSALSLSGVDIVCYDETLSTHDAINSLLHQSARRRKQKEHSVAAVIILQSWLDSLTSPIVKCA